MLLNLRRSRAMQREAMLDFLDAWVGMWMTVAFDMWRYPDVHRRRRGPFHG